MAIRLVLSDRVTYFMHVHTQLLLYTVHKNTASILNVYTYTAAHHCININSFMLRTYVYSSISFKAFVCVTTPIL